MFDLFLVNKKNTIIYILILICFIINGLGLLSPTSSGKDAHLYAEIANNIYLSHDFINLTHNGAAWLDKPHFPFWITAISYFIFGPSTFAYMLPGFIFYMLGGLYTYKLSKKLFEQESIALFSVIVYLTSLRLMISGSLDIRAEAFLLGEITTACYYWLMYYEKTTIRSLLLGAFFTALALMTKGLFTLVTVFSGVLCLGIYQKNWKQFITLKWISAGILTLILIGPEIVSLYLQFDNNPEVIVRGQSHVSGVRWFFIESQLGRFFSTGAIQKGNYHLKHFFYFFHTMLWSFLPWSVIFIAAIINLIRKFSHFNSHIKTALVFLMGSFFPTFIMFSLTSFQLDYYINIIFPFSAIIVSFFIIHCSQLIDKPCLYIQRFINLLMLMLIISLPIILNKYALLYGLFILIPVGTISILLFTSVKFKTYDNTIIYSITLINVIFIYTLIIFNFIASNNLSDKQLLQKFSLKGNYHLKIYRKKQ